MSKTIKKIAGKAIVQRWLNVCLAFFAAASLNTACSDKDDDTLPVDTAQSNENVQVTEPSQSVEQPSQPEKAVRTLSVSIPATINDDGSLSKYVSIDGTTCTGKFKSTENVYVYDENDNVIIEGYLQPNNISDDGKSCTLNGTLTTESDITGHKLSLYYNASGRYGNGEEIVVDFCFDYTEQNGLSDKVLDGGIATDVIVKSTEFGNLTTEDPAIFVLQQSVFRFKFVDEENNPINVKYLKIQSTNDGFSKSYSPLKDEYGSANIAFDIDESAAKNFIYVALRIREANSDGDKFSFIVGDEYFEYEGTRSAPSDGFKNGKFYYNSDPIVLKKTLMVRPTIDWTSARETQPTNGIYSIYGPNFEDPYAVTISGESVGYSFLMIFSSGTVTLDQLDATLDVDRWFLNARYDLTVELSGDNFIKSSMLAINVSGVLKLTGNGTLTVTTNSIDEKGIKGNNYGGNDVPALLAAEGHTVTISEMKDNDDGTYTWTYTVVPNKEPKIDWTSVMDGKPVEPDAYDTYIVSGPSEGSPSELTISGESIGYRFFMAKGSTTTLSYLSASYQKGETFIESSNGDLNLVIDGENTIECDQGIAIWVNKGNLTLSGNGSLTITVSAIDEARGIEAENYLRNDNPSDLALNGYTVSLSGPEPNDDGTYSWTYTVQPNSK